MNKDRFYRNWVKSDGLVSFEVRVGETDLLISSNVDLREEAKRIVLSYRKEIEGFIKKNKDFYASLTPIKLNHDGVPEIIEAMVNASRKAEVGPMASVAGAIAEFVGRRLLEHSKDIIVENGGDIFLKTSEKRAVGVFAGNSPYSGKLALEIEPAEEGIGICTSSGTVGHSLSFGKADAVVVISNDTALADAVATATANRVRNKGDLRGAIDFARSIDEIKGTLIIIGDRMASWGEIRLGRKV